jgi:hypothetical protein
LARDRDIEDLAARKRGPLACLDEGLQAGCRCVSRGQSQGKAERGENGLHGNTNGGKSHDGISKTPLNHSIRIRIESFESHGKFFSRLAGQKRLN